MIVNAPVDEPVQVTSESDVTVVVSYPQDVYEAVDAAPMEVYMKPDSPVVVT